MISPTPTPSPTASGATPAPANNGIAYIPDGGVGNAGIYVVHFEDVNAHLISPSPASTPLFVSFPSSVGAFAISTDGGVSIASLLSTNGSNGPAYNLVQDVLGVGSGSIVPVGTRYNTLYPPVPPSSPYPTPTPDRSAVAPAISGASVIGVSAVAVGLVVGPGSSGILGLGSLNAAPPVFGGFVPFGPGAGNAFYNVEAGSGAGEVLLRGPTALEVFSVGQPGGTFQFTNPVVNTSAGYQPNIIYGRGGMSINPSNSATAVLLQNPGPDDVEFVNGLPTAINLVSHVTLASQPNSVVVINNGTNSLAIVGTNAGFYVLSGVNAGPLVVEKPYLPVGSDGAANSPLYTGCDGKPNEKLANVTSIGVSIDLRFVAALGHQTGQACSSLVAVPLVDTTSGTPSPSPTPSPGYTYPPTIFYQSVPIVPSPSTDYMRVR